MALNPKGNEYGQLPQYEVGDKVKVWPIYKNPIGTVIEIVNAECFPIKYLIRYDYFSGGSYTEVFEECDLTLFERRYNFQCNCKTVSDRHASWCNRTNDIRRW